MKVYINCDSLSIIKIEREKPFYQGSNFVDRIRILLDNTTEAYGPTLMFRLPTGRKVGPLYPIGIDAGLTRLISEESKTWYYYDFIISSEAGLLAYPGQLEVSVVLNYYNTGGTIIKQAVVGTVVNEVVKTTVYGEGNIIVVGEDPEVILNNLNLTIANLADRQSSVEAVWSNQISKLIPIIKNYLNDSKDTRIEFYDDIIKIVHADNVVATFDHEDGLVVNGIKFKDGMGENLTVDDIRSVDGHIDDTLYVEKEIQLGDIDVKSTLDNLSMDLKRLLNIIQDYLDEGEVEITLSDNSIGIKHNGNLLLRLSDNDGNCFYNETEFKKVVTFDQDVYIKNDNLFFILDDLRSFCEEAKTIASEKVEQEIKDRTAAIEALKSSLIDGAPQALDTLLELSKALGDDPNFATTITNLINQKFAECKKFTEDNYVKTEDISSILFDFNEADLDEVFKGVYT
ncbi:MAG: hypothetical protein NC087_04960 [Anaeroplasma bactoclasticum]|nr:hypothetical protein [Anaeroplasma bactoclasticum]